MADLLKSYHPDLQVTNSLLYLHCTVRLVLLADRNCLQALWILQLGLFPEDPLFGDLILCIPLHWTPTV